MLKKFLMAVAVTVGLVTGSLVEGSLVARAQDSKTQDGKAQDTTAPASGINGKWHFVLDTPGGDRDIDADFTVDAEGKVTGMFGKDSAVGTYKDGNLDLGFDMTAEETGETAQMKLSGKLDATSTITGKWQFSAYGGTFTAARPKK